METSTLLWLGGIVAAVAAGWGQLKSIATAVAGRVVVTHDIDFWLMHPLREYLRRQGRCLVSNNSAFISDAEFVRPLGRTRRVAFEIASRGATLFLFGRWPVWFKPEKWVQEGATITYIRGTLDLRAIIEAALADDAVHRGGGAMKRFRVHHVVGKPKQTQISLMGGQNEEGGSGGKREDWWHHAIAIGYGKDPVHWQPDDIGEPQAPDPGAHLVLTGEQAEVFTEVDRWLESSSWYRDRGLKWRRGYLLYGPPGTGKTSTIKAIAQTHDLPVWSFDLASLSNQEFIREWQRMLAEAPVVALFEDIDAVFHGRENIVPEHTSGGLTFDCLLNMLDGVEEANGVLTFITTNELGAVDPALADRPGRVDRAVLFDRFTAVQLHSYVWKVLGGDRALTDRAFAKLGRTGSVSPARAQEVCLGLLQESAGQRLTLAREVA